MAVVRAPLLGGERNPIQANTRATKTIMSSCRPVPESTESSMMAVGGLNTSPWTSFQPKSSCTSSYTHTHSIVSQGWNFKEDNLVTQSQYHSLYSYNALWWKSNLFCKLLSVSFRGQTDISHTRQTHRVLTVESALLYLAMSLCSDRARIMPTMDERKMVINTELMRLNHWTLFWETDERI